MSARPASALTGARKAAVLVALMGEDAASTVLRNLSERDIHTLARELSEIGVIPLEMMQQVLEEYHKQASAGPQGIKAGPDFAGRLLAKAFGPEQAKGVIAKIAASQDSAAAQVQALRKADPSQLAKFLGVEHPQTIALTLAHLDEKQVAAVLTKMPEQTRAEAVKRLAQLRQFSPEIAERVSSVLNRRLQALGEQSRKSYAGFKSVADVLNRMEGSVAKTILDALEQEDANLAISIRNFMFTFEDLLGVADVAIREWLGTMDKKTLALALKGASDNLKDHIFRSMSSRAADMLKEDMEALGPVRNKDVVQAQQEAVALLRNLEAEGKVVLKSEGDDEYVV